MKKLFGMISIIALAVLGVSLFLQQRVQSSQRALAEFLPQISAITLYDDPGGAADSNTLASATSASFPVEAFRRAASSARARGGTAIWKGSSLAVFTLRDGTQRQARFSYHGGFFTIEGMVSHFVAPGGGSSEFQQLHEQLIREQFVPKRREQNIERDGR